MVVIIDLSHYGIRTHRGGMRCDFFVLPHNQESLNLFP